MKSALDLDFMGGNVATPRCMHDVKLCDCVWATPEPEPIVPLREVVNREIRKALAHTNGSVGRAAKLLGIGRATLYRRIAEMERAR